MVVNSSKHCVRFTLSQPFCCTLRRTAAFADCVMVSPSAVSLAVGKDALEIAKQSHHRGLKSLRLSTA